MSIELACDWFIYLKEIPIIVYEPDDSDVDEVNSKYMLHDKQKQDHMHARNKQNHLRACQIHLMALHQQCSVRMRDKVLYMYM